jgi:hypothetical protein
VAVGQRWDEATKHAGRCGKEVRQENGQGSFEMTSPMIPRYRLYHRLIDLPSCFWRNRTHLDSFGTLIITTSTCDSDPGFGH